jgi:MoxR-like ATPase
VNSEKIFELIEKVRNNVKKVIIGKEDVTDLLLIALIASGNVLLEDVPGMGKTLLAKTMAKSLNCSFKRIQFTPDLLPSDLTGINFYNQKEGQFEFMPGPVFSNILLADEINRATPRTQSSMLECMEEKQVTIDGKTRILNRPFMVIATQNPIEIQGTFPLPEAQLDRFLVKVKMGFPSKSEGIEILKRFTTVNPFEGIEAVASAEEIIFAQDNFSKTYVSDAMYSYIVEIAEKTREHKDVILGVSPRGSQAMLKASQVYAIIQKRDFVTPDDVKAVAVPVCGHRMILKDVSLSKANKTESIIDEILKKIPVPAEEDFMKRNDKK